MGNGVSAGGVGPSDSAVWTHRYHDNRNSIPRSVSQHLEMPIKRGFAQPVLEERYEPPSFPPSGTGTGRKNSIRWSTPSTSLKNLEKDVKAIKVTFDVDLFRLSVLKVVNEYRQIHGSPPLIMDEELTATAQLWADTLAQEGFVRHTSSEQRMIDRGKVGENLAQISNCPENFSPGRNYVDVNYQKELELYDFNSPGFSKATGHFTQMIWRDSKCLGIGVAFAKIKSKNCMIVVEHYFPAGNITGKFEWNVLPKYSTSSDLEKIMEKIKRPPQMDIAHLEKFREQNLKSHNMYRQLHGSPPLTLDDGLCELAQEQAERIALTKEFAPSKKEALTLLSGGVVGESMDRIGFVTSSSTFNGRNPVNRLYRKIEDFDFHNMKHSEETDGVEQILWRSSRKLGVGAIKYFNGNGICLLTVHHYYPARTDDFEANIYPLGIHNTEEDELISSDTEFKEVSLSLHEMRKQEERQLDVTPGDEKAIEVSETEMVGSSSVCPIEQIERKSSYDYWCLMTQ